MTYPGYAYGPPVQPAPGHAYGPPVQPAPGHAYGPPVQPAPGYYGHPDPARGFYGHLDPAPPAAAGRVKKNRRARSVPMQLLAFMVGAIVIFVVRSFLAGVDDPTVGDCVRATADSGYDVVDCGTAEAQFRIVGEEEGRWTAEEVQAATGLCADFPTTVAYVWEAGFRSNTGTVYCAGSL